MDGLTTGNPERFWKPIGPDAAAGYQLDALGEYVLIGVVFFGPTTEKLRGTRMTDIATTDYPGRLRAINQDDPPGPERIAQVWARSHGKPADSMADLGRHFKESLLTPAARVITGSSSVTGTGSVSSRGTVTAAQVEEVASPDMLSRRPGEDPDDFYRRIASAHAVLSRATNKPTAELAHRAGVPVGTAGAWVSRARARGLMDKEGVQQ